MCMRNKNVFKPTPKSYPNVLSVLETRILGCGLKLKTMKPFFRLVPISVIVLVKIHVLYTSELQGA